MEKNTIANGPNYSAINYTQNNNQLLSLKQNEEESRKSSLDIYSPKEDISNHINHVADLKQLRILKDRGKLVESIALTKIKKVMKTQ